MLKDSIQRSYFVNRQLREIALRTGAHIIDPVQSLCVLNKCLIAKNGRNLYRDDDHLSPFGSEQLHDLVENALTDGSMPVPGT